MRIKLWPSDIYGNKEPFLYLILSHLCTVSQSYCQNVLVCFFLAPTRNTSNGNLNSYPLPNPWPSNIHLANSAVTPEDAFCTPDMPRLFLPVGLCSLFGILFLSLLVAYSNTSEFSWNIISSKFSFIAPVTIAHKLYLYIYCFCLFPSPTTDMAQNQMLGSKELTRSVRVSEPLTETVRKYFPETWIWDLVVVE